MEITEGGRALPSLASFYFRGWRCGAGEAGKTGRTGKTGMIWEEVGGGWRRLEMTKKTCPAGFPAWKVYY